MRSRGRGSVMGITPARFFQKSSTCLNVPPVAVRRQQRPLVLVQAAHVHRVVPAAGDSSALRCHHVALITAIIGSLLGGIVVARQCALAASTQDFSKGYGAPGRNSESGEWLMRLVAHFPHPPMRSLHPRGQESICFRFWREPESILS